MKPPSRATLACLAIPLVVLLSSAPGASARVRAGALPRPLDVLFIGNSYTRFNNLPRIFEHLAESVPGTSSRLRVTAIANPGWDLSRHWAVRQTREAIARGHFTHVVLQGHSLSAIQQRAEFEGVARLFDGEIDRTGARTVLYETWARRAGSRTYVRGDFADSPAEMQAQITECYEQVARAVDADVAPVGRAFLLAQQRTAHVDLFGPDGAHPSPAGTYLAAATLYAVIAHADPRQARWRTHGLSRRIAAELRDVAWHAVHAPGVM